MAYNGQGGATLSGASTLTYQPGGTNSSGVFTSWTTLMAVRGTIKGTVDIIIDDSITSPAVVDSGTWELGRNTRLIGKKGSSSVSLASQGGNGSLTQLSIPNGATLQNPYVFTDLYLIGKATTAGSFSINVGGAFSAVVADFINCYLTTDGTASKPLIKLTGLGNINLFGSTIAVTPGVSTAYIFSNPALIVSYINMYDSSEIQSNTIAYATAGLNQLVVNINSVSCTYSLTQTGITGTSFTVNKPFKKMVVNVSTTYTVLKSDDIIFTDSTGGAFTITLPITPLNGEIYAIKDTNGTAATNNITVSGNGKNIDGFSTFLLNQAYAESSFVYNGTQWSVL